jgi:DHA1 family tetracycline resistance protein-like MFS transporter
MNQASRSRRMPLLLMALTILIDFTGFGLILPLLPFWAEHLGANAFGVGLLITVYALAQFLFTPVLGVLSDRYGRRPVIVASLLIEALSLAGTALVGSLPLLLLARFVGGLGASNIGSAQAVVADVTTPKERAKGMGLIGAAIGVGFVIGPALGSVLGPLGITLPFWVAMGVALANALLVLLFLPETRTVRALDGAPERRRGFFSGWQDAARYGAVLRLALINLLLTIAFTAMESVFALFAQHLFGWTAMQIGYIFTYVGAIVVIMQGGLVGQLVKRLGEQRLLQAGLVLLGAGLLLLAFSTHVALVLLALGILSIGDGAANPTVSALLSFASPEDAQGETLGLAQGVGGLGRIVGPLMAGGLYTLLRPGTPFLAGGMLSLVAALLALPGLPAVVRHGRHSRQAERVGREVREAEESSSSVQNRKGRALSRSVFLKHRV